MTEFESLIADFSKKSGLDIAIAKDGSADIEADGIYVTLQPSEERGDVTMFTLPLFNHPADEAMMRKALAMAAHGRGTGGFFLGTEDGAFVLSGTRRLAGYGAEALANDLLALSRATKRVAQSLALAAAGADEEARAAANAQERESGKTDEFCNLDALRV